MAPAVSPAPGDAALEDVAEAPAGLELQPSPEPVVVVADAADAIPTAEVPMAVADAAGIDADTVGDMLDASAMGNPLIRAKAKLMSARDYSPNFQVYLQQKDLRLVVALSDELQVPTPITSAANNMYVQSMQRGFGNQDFAAVREAYRAP